jgi:GntR family transcriptional regulator
MSTVHERLLTLWRSAAEAGKPLPSEAILASTLGVSRPKVREELIRLESDGLVTRVPNSGTFPNRAALDIGLRLDQSYEFASMIAAAGFESTVEVLESSWCEIDADRAVLLNVRRGSSAFQTKKRWFADGKPIMIATDLIPASRADHGEPDPRKTVFELVEELRGSAVEWETTWVAAKSADSTDIEMLGLTPSESVLDLTTVGISVLGTQLYVANETHRQGVIPYGMIRSIPGRRALK